MSPGPSGPGSGRLFPPLSAPPAAAARSWPPPMDLVEAEDHFLLRADLPGMREEDVSIEVRDNTLRISGERKAEHEQRERGWYRLGRQFGKFSRALTLPEGINPDTIEASFDHGVLEVKIPKPEERKPRRIAIKEAANGNGKPATLEGTATES